MAKVVLDPNKKLIYNTALGFPQPSNGITFLSAADNTMAIQLQSHLSRAGGRPRKAWPESLPYSDVAYRQFKIFNRPGEIVAVVASLKFLSSTFEDSIVEHVLDTDENGLRKFVDDYSKDRSRAFKFFVKGCSHFGICTSQSGKIDHVVSICLLLSDLFIKQDGRNTRYKVLSLVQLYQPPCFHPVTYLNKATTMQKPNMFRATLTRDF